ncbi:MAG TPA: fibronectin type III domain-containing protein, partial [Niastella sp.]
MTWIIYSMLLVTGLFGYNSAGAQTIHPVTASLQLVPPYSVYLADYAAPGNDKLRVILTLNDLSQSSYAVRLRLKVELNGRAIMQTDPAYRPSAITIMPGMPQIITGTQLNEYLVSDHLQFLNGFSRDNYERTKALPEGAYRICVTAYDYNRSDDVAISNDGCNIFFFQKNEAPLLNFPLCNSRVDRKDPQFLSFTWSIRNTPSFVTGSSGTGYRFELFEVRPKGSNPEYIVRSSTPIYSVATDNAMLLYGPGEPRLQDSMQYVWRVQAYDKDGRDAYQNNGYSQTCVFTYGGLDPFVVNNIGKPELFGEGLGERSGKWWWHISNAPSIDGWNIQYRKQDTTGAKTNDYDWNKQFLTDTVFHLFSLEPDNTYEAQVQPVKNGINGSWSETVVLHTMPKRVYECGKDDAANSGDTGVFKPLYSAIAGMIVRVGDFDMQLLEVSGGNGRFSGYGAIATPLLGMRLNVKFADVTINDKLVLTQGEAIALTEGIDAWIKDRTKVNDDVNTIKDWTETMPDFETASLSELKDFANELLGISEGVWNDTYVYTEEERKQVKDALAEIKAAMQELGDSDPANDAAAEKKLRTTLKKVEPLLEKISDNIGKGVLVQLGLTRKKLYKAVIANYIKELQTSIASLSKEQAMENALAKHGPHNDEGVRRFMANLPACMRSLDETKQKALADYLQQKISVDADWSKYAEALQAKIAKQQADETAMSNAEKHLEDAGKNKTDLTVEEWAVSNADIYNEVNERMCPYVVEEYDAIQNLNSFSVPGNAAFVVLSLPSRVYLFPYGLAVTFGEDIQYEKGGKIVIGGKKYISLFKGGSHDFTGFFEESKLADIPKDENGVYKQADLDKADGWLPKNKYKVKYQLKQTYTRELFEDLQKSDEVDKEKAFEIATLLDGVDKKVYDLFVKLTWKDRIDQEKALYEIGYGLGTVEQFEKGLQNFLDLITKRVTALNTYVTKWNAETDSKKKTILRDLIIKAILWRFEDQDYLSINNDLRDKVLHILTDGSLHRENMGDKIAMKLVTKVPEGDQKAWMQTLSEGSRLKELFADVDGDEFNDMMTGLSAMVMKHFKKPATLTAEDALNYITFKEGLFTGTVLEKTIDESGFMLLGSREQFTNNVTNGFGKATEWTIVHFKSDFKLNEKVKFTKGAKVPMPTLLAY